MFTLESRFFRSVAAVLYLPGEKSDDHLVDFIRKVFEDTNGPFLGIHMSPRL